LLGKHHQKPQLLKQRLKQLPSLLQKLKHLFLEANHFLRNRSPRTKVFLGHLQTNQRLKACSVQHQTSQQLKAYLVHLLTNQLAINRLLARYLEEDLYLVKKKS